MRSRANALLWRNASVALCGENFSKSDNGNRGKRNKYSREQKRRCDRTELLRKPQPSTEDCEEPRDRQQQRRCAPRHGDPFEAPCSAFKFGLNVFLYIFKLMFRFVEFLMD